jgi:hypothetical protein
MKQYNNGQRKGMMYGGMSRRKPMMYGGTATKPRKKAQMGGMMQSAPMMQPQKQEKPTQMQPMGMSMNMAEGGKAFPDLTGDGKVTKKDILKGRGVKMMYGGKAKTRG